MPLFDDPVPSRLLWPLSAPLPKRRARRLLDQFQSCFPELTYDMDLMVELPNGQAFVLKGRKYVRLYGGLVRHRKVGSAALAVALAHETGHHLGGAPFHQFYNWLSNEERATEWAMTVGLGRVFGARAREIGDRGWRELNSIWIG